MVRAISTGLLLFCGVMLAGALSLALIQYYQRYDFALLFPLFGICCLILGENVLQKMETELGFDEGGAGASLLRCLFAGLVVWCAASSGIGTMQYLSYGILNIFEIADVPRYLPVIEYNETLRGIVK